MGEMSLWQFASMRKGFIDFHTVAEKPEMKAPSRDQHFAMVNKWKKTLEGPTIQ